MKPAPSTEALEVCFELLEQAVREKRRCPTTAQLSSLMAGRGLRGYAGGGHCTSALAHAGRIMVRVYVHNYRVVTLLEGELRGKSTLPCPKVGAKAYLVIDQTGTRRRRFHPMGQGIGGFDGRASS